jgi:hypothetical protein
LLIITIAATGQNWNAISEIFKRWELIELFVF